MSTEKEEIKKLQEDLDKAYTEMAEGVREFLDLREAFKKVHKEKQNLKSAAIKAITSSSNTSEETAKKMLDEWFKTVSREDNDV